MKKIFVLLLPVCLLLSGCAELIPARTTMPPETVPIAETAPAVIALEPSTEPTTEPVTEPPTEPEPEVYYNPLNGEILDAPFSGRIIAVSINNRREAVPHSGVSNADFFFETFVNGSIIRGIAMFTDVSGLTAIGPVRSDRLVFNDLVTRYDCVMFHAGGSNQVLNDANKLGMDHFNIDAWNNQALTSFRDKDRRGYQWEDILFAVGDGLIEFCSQNGVRMESDPDRFFQRFAEDATPQDGETAENITVTITVNQFKKDSTFVYDPEIGKYVWHQYDREMIDERSGEPEAFRNVLILMGTIPYEGEYQRPNLMLGGEGWFACGGKAIPIKWGTMDETSPLWYTTMDDEPLVLSQGNTYVAITQTGSAVTGIGE